MRMATLGNVAGSRPLAQDFEQGARSGSVDKGFVQRGAAQSFGQLKEAAHEGHERVGRDGQYELEDEAFSWPVRVKELGSTFIAFERSADLWLREGVPGHGEVDDARERIARLLPVGTSAGGARRAGS